jgi:hypothetical protein
VWGEGSEPNSRPGNQLWIIVSYLVKISLEAGYQNALDGGRVPRGPIYRLFIKPSPHLGSRFHLQTHPPFCGSFVRSWWLHWLLCNYYRTKLTLDSLVRANPADITLVLTGLKRALQCCSGDEVSGRRTLRPLCLAQTSARPSFRHCHAGIIVSNTMLHDLFQPHSMDLFLLTIGTYGMLSNPSHSPHTA